jgi:hypothetical protein
MAQEPQPVQDENSSHVKQAETEIHNLPPFYKPREARILPRFQYLLTAFEAHASHTAEASCPL